MAATLDVPASFRSSATRPGAFGLLREGVSEVLSRRRLIRYLVAADLKKKGADTVLGNLWWVIDPLLQMVVYVILVSFIFQRSQPDYPLFLFAALLPWKWFTSSVTDAIGSVTTQDRLIRQVQFPKIVLPLAAVGAGVVNFAFGLIPLSALLLVFYHDRASAMVVLIPVIAAVQLVFTMAVALVVSTANVFFRDVTNVARHALQLWFYLSPVLYSAQQAQDVAKNHATIGKLIALNPFYILMESYRDVIYDGRLPAWAGLGALLGLSIGLLALATLFFKRLEPSFAKVL
jgi:ABC-type polysaccharide/polyol phosphate export permease